MAPSRCRKAGHMTEAGAPAATESNSHRTQWRRGSFGRTRKNDANCGCTKTTKNKLQVRTKITLTFISLLGVVNTTKL